MDTPLNDFALDNLDVVASTADDAIEYAFGADPFAPIARHRLSDEEPDADDADEVDDDDEDEEWEDDDADDDDWEDDDDADDDDDDDDWDDDDDDDDKDDWKDDDEDEEPANLMTSRRTLTAARS